MPQAGQGAHRDGGDMASALGKRPALWRKHSYLVEKAGLTWVPSGPHLAPRQRATQGDELWSSLYATASPASKMGPHTH